MIILNVLSSMNGSMKNSRGKTGSTVKYHSATISQLQQNVVVYIKNQDIALIIHEDVK